jgi:putative cardiolipin synthase
MKLLVDLRKRGATVRVLTNSLESSNVLVAHAGYMHYRQPLLESGAQLYEVRARLGNARGSGESTQMASYGNYALHAKLFVFDRQRVFIGSMNFDQRSMHLNTEIGLIIHSPELAQQTAARFEAVVHPENSYELSFIQGGVGGKQLVWRTVEGGKMVVYDKEPARSDWQRFKAKFFTLLPMDREL